MVEQRRSARSPINAHLEFTEKGADGKAISGVAKDISVGGMFIQTNSPAAFGASVEVRIRVPGHKEDMILPGVVRWTRADGMGLQFGLLGARETHVITEIVKSGVKR